MKRIIINNVVHEDACDNCGEHQAMHHGEKDLCCKCYVEAGNPPADWHRVCMETYNILKRKSEVM
jgi:hypothetical protein